MVLTEEERSSLERVARRHKARQALAMRARVVLACAEAGSTNMGVASALGVSRLPATLDVPMQAAMSMQAGFGLLKHEIAKGGAPFADRVVTTSPDVTVSTNLGAWVNRRGLFARIEMTDVFKKECIPSTLNWHFSLKGQHLELGIAQMNLFIALGVLGLSHIRHGINREQIRTFDGRASGLRWVYTNYFMPEHVTARKECSAVAETMAWQPVDAPDLDDPLPHHMLFVDEEGRPETQFRR